MRRERRCPITGFVVQLVAVQLAAIAFAIGEDGAKKPVVGSHVGQEIEAFF